MKKVDMIKPCHICGSPASVVDEDDGETWRIECSRDGCDCVPVHYTKGNSRSSAAAIQTWNRRKR